MSYNKSFYSYRPNGKSNSTHILPVLTNCIPLSKNLTKLTQQIKGKKMQKLYKFLMKNFTVIKHYRKISKTF